MGNKANVHAKLGADLVSALAYGVDLAKGERVLPPGLGLNVNFPKINGTSPLPWLVRRRTSAEKEPGGRR